jgi:Cu/Ag efflux protein CusF
MHSILRLHTLAAAAALTATLAAVGCSGGGAAGGDGDAASSAAARYEVRGQVSSVPDPGDPLSNLVIRHEAIDGFVGMDGEVVGMDSMSMPFPVAEDVDLAGLEAGDKVSFTFVVDWDGDPAYQVTRIEELPADTAIELRKARPPAAPEDAAAEGGDGEQH